MFFDFYSFFAKPENLLKPNAYHTAPPAQVQTVNVKDAKRLEISSSIPNSQEKINGLKTFLRQFGLGLTDCVLGWANDNGVAKEGMKCKSRVNNLAQLGVFTRQLDLHLKKHNSGNNPVVFENNNFQYFFTRILYMQETNGQITDLIFILTPVSKIQLGRLPQSENITKVFKANPINNNFKGSPTARLANLKNSSVY